MIIQAFKTPKLMLASQVFGRCVTYIWILLRQVAAAAQRGCWAPAFAPHRLPCRAAQVVAAAAVAPTAVAGDCAPRLGTWPTLKKVGKSCQEEKGSGTPAPTTVLHGILLMTSLHSCWSRKRGGHSFSTLVRKLWKGKINACLTSGSSSSAKQVLTLPIFKLAAPLQGKWSFQYIPNNRILGKASS